MTHEISIDQDYLEKYAKADWIETSTGLKFWPANPRPEDINIFDIAHALALKCRYGGHSKHFYSVAEHATTLALYARFLKLPVRTQYHLLMHDCSEAYLPDVPRPIKHFFPDLILMEKRLGATIRDKFGLDHDLPKEVKEFDSRIIRDERKQCLLPSGNEWQTDVLQPLNVTLSLYGPAEAEARFLQAYQVIAAQHLGRHVLMAYDDGEFRGAASTDRLGYKAPNVMMADLIGNCALIRTEDGQPAYMHGNFDLSVNHTV